MLKLWIRIDLSRDSAVGPGKIRLLELIEKTGSISAAGRAMAISYRRAWLLVDELNCLFKEPVATTKHGGEAGGGAQLTAFGRSLVRNYREMEEKARAALSKHLIQLQAAMPNRRRRAAGGYRSRPAGTGRPARSFGEGPSSPGASAPPLPRRLRR